MRWIACVWLVCGAIATPSAGTAGEPHAADDEAVLKKAGLATDSPALLDYFQKRTLSDVDYARLKRLIVQLGDDSFEAREKASAGLLEHGASAEPLLRQALTNPDVEIVRRAEECLRVIKQRAGPNVPLAAARLLAVRRPRGAGSALLGYLPFAENEVVADEICQDLVRLANPHGRPDAALVAALDDKNGVRRAAAAFALVCAGAKDVRPKVLKLLHDRDPHVLFRAGLALAENGTPEAIPVLIDLVERLPPGKARLVEDFLFRVAGDGAPWVGLGAGAASRRQFRTAWAQWWQTRGQRLDLAKALTPPKLRGYTLLLLLDAGRALEIDAKGKPRWEFDGLQFPLDIQLIPAQKPGEDDHVLVAEHGANRVTERDLQGEIIWKRDVDAPLMAQRLANGHTFIANVGSFLEVDQAGREVYTLQPPSGYTVMKATKLRSGEIVCLLQGGKVARLDSAGRVLQSFSLNVRFSGGRMEVLPNGHFLIPEIEDNKVVEYDADGKAVWEYDVEQPIAATRLAGGNILVTSMDRSNYRAVELDRLGRVVWEYRPVPNTRVNRAFRR